MVDYFDTQVAYNPDTEELQKSAVFEVFAEDDLSFTTPLAVYDPVSGAALSPLQATKDGVVEQFRVAGDPETVILKCGIWTTKLTSKYGTKGDPGLSAFQQAVAGGYPGTEGDFNAALAQVQAMIVDASLDGDGHLILATVDGGTIDVGLVKGADGAPGAPGADGVDGAPGAPGADGADGADGAVTSLIAGSNIIIDDTDPAHPVISATGGGGGGGGADWGDIGGSIGAQADLQAALNAKAPVASPNFTGNPTAPTPAAGDNDNSIANTAWVQIELAALIAGAPGTLNTLGELAASIGNNPDFIGTMMTALAGKQSIDADLTALAGLSSIGVVVRTGDGTATARSIAGSAPVSVTNGDGVAGNPTISVAAATDTAAGIAERATTAETVAGADDIRFTTPAGVAAAIAASGGGGGGGAAINDAATATTSVWSSSKVSTELGGKQASDSDLTAVAGLSAAGLIARTGAGAAAARTIAGSTPVSVTNGDGVAGNPTIAVADASDTAKGVAERATTAEVLTGTDDVRFTTPAGVKAATDAAALVAVNAQSSNYTLVLADTGRAVEMSNAAARTITIPPNASVAFPIGTVIECARMGGGLVTIVAGAGVTIRNAGSLVLAEQYDRVRLRKRATNEWHVVTPGVKVIVDPVDESVYPDGTIFLYTS